MSLRASSVLPHLAWSRNLIENRVVVQQNVAVERREFCAMKWSSRSGGGAEVEEEEQRRAGRERGSSVTHTSSLHNTSYHFWPHLKKLFCNPPKMGLELDKINSAKLKGGPLGLIGVPLGT